MIRQFLATLTCSLCVLVAHAVGPQVELKTNLGEIVLELDAELAPKTVANFLRYVQDGHYNGIIFHRVIPGFMIQGGGMDETLTEKRSRAPIENEAANGLKNLIGTVAMARTNDPHSASAQFFINVADNHFLDFRAPNSREWGYAVFGKVIKGMDIVHKIEKRPTRTQNMYENVPIDAVVIESARVLAGESEKTPENKPAARAPVSKGKAVRRPNPKTPDKPEEPYMAVKLHTSHGVITLELDTDKAPVTVENFIAYVTSGHYDNTVFHRVIDGFMIQGGGFGPGMKEKPTRGPIENEAGNGLRNTRGTIAMARTNDPHSATAQFFINVVDNDFLDFRAPDPQSWGYCVFGHVSDGLDVIDKIRKVTTGTKGFYQDVPKEDIVIERAEIV